MTVLVSDSFNRANNATTLGSTDSYNGGTAKTWVYANASTPTFGISNNQAVPESSSSSVHDCAYFDVGQSNVTVSANIVSNSTNANAGLAFRYIDNNNFWQTAFINGSSLVLYKAVNNSFTSVATYNMTVTNGTSYAVSVTANGNNITVSLNGTQVISVTDSANSTGTQYGLRFAQTSCAFDNFQVQDLNTGGSISVSGTSKSSSNQTTTLSDSRALSGSVVKSSSSQKTATLSNQVKISGTWKSNTSQTAGMTDAVPVTLSSTVKSQSTVTLVSLLDSDGLSSTVKSNSSGNAAILLDRMAESTTVSSTSSEHDGMTVLRAMSTTVESNTTASSASLSMYNGTWVLVDSNAKSNSSSSLASQVSRLMVSTVKTQSIVTGGLRQNVNVQSTVLSATGTTNNVTIQGPIVRLVSRNRSNSFAKVASTMTKTNPKVTTRSFTKATGYLLNLQVVSQLIETIKFKRGNKATLPTLNVGEPAFTLDTDEMFVGSSTGNIKILGMITATSVANLPNPSSTNEWSIAGILGDGSTTADTLYMCLKSSNGTYSWKQIISG